MHISSLHKSRSVLTPPAFCFSFSTIHPKGTGQSKIKLGEEQVLAELTPKPWVHLAEAAEDPQSPEVTAAEECHATPCQQAYNPNGSILCPTGGLVGAQGPPLGCQPAQPPQHMAWAHPAAAGGQGHRLPLHIPPPNHLPGTSRAGSCCLHTPLRFPKRGSGV